MLDDFKKLMAARFFFTFGVQMQAVIVGWQVYELTHDPLALGLVGLAEAVPALGLALFAGYVVDRSRPLTVYQRVLLGSLVSALVLLVSQLMSARIQLAGQVFALYLASVITGAARGFSQPAIYATVPRIVPREKLPQASAWMAVVLQVARVAGPALGGLVFGYFGMTVCVSVVCVFLLMASLSIFFIKAAPSAPAQPPVRLPVLQELMSGVSFVFGHPILLPALSLDMISVLFGGVTAMLPIYAREILMIGPRGLGILRAAPAVGAALCSYTLTTRLNFRRCAGRWLFTAVSGFGACILVFAISRSFWLSLLALGLSGAFDSVSMIIRSTAVQAVSPDAMRGRISAVNSIFIGSSNELGEFESGVAAKILGTVPSVIFGGVMCLLTVLGASLLAPALRKMDLDQL
ncbi:MAG: MFS transporter [Oligoflexia bacterium]|nr:MFS transporter [Oligoflexia bacterium]